MSNKKIILTEGQVNALINESIRRILDEELSVAEDVKGMAEDVFKTVRAGYYDFYTELFGTDDYHVTCERVDIKSMGNETGAFVDYGKKNFHVEVPFFNNKLVSNMLYQSIYHELEHAYQIYKKGTGEQKYGRYYSAAVPYLQNGGTDDEMDIARYIYLCSWAEQDAMANELYSDLMNKPSACSKEKAIEIIKNSSIYKARYYILSMIENLNQSLYTDQYDAEISLYNHRPPKEDKPEKKQRNNNKRWLISMGKRGIRRIDRKINNVTKKALKDKGESYDFYPLKFPW